MKKILSFTLFSLILVSCSNDSTDDLTTPLPTIVTYNSNVKSIMDTSCATSGCHNATSNSANLILENYTQVKNAFLNRNALSRMENTTASMPPSGNLPNTTIQILKDWRDQGYLEN